MLQLQISIRNLLILGGSRENCIDTNARHPDEEIDSSRMTARLHRAHPAPQVHETLELSDTDNALGHSSASLAAADTPPLPKETTAERPAKNQRSPPTTEAKNTCPTESGDAASSPSASKEPQLISAFVRATHGAGNGATKIVQGALPALPSIDETNVTPTGTPVAATANAPPAYTRAAAYVSPGAPAANTRAAKRALAAAQAIATARAAKHFRSSAFDNELVSLSKAAEAKLEFVVRMSVEYVQVMLHLGSMDVDSVRMVRNEAVDMAFAIAVSGVRGPREIVKVLHGTNVAAIDAIVREGFKVGGEEVQVRHGSACGKGVYLTTTVELAAQHSPMHHCRYMLLCELCVDAKCIKSSGGVFVQPDKALVRPLHVVEFKVPPPREVNRYNENDCDEKCNCANCFLMRFNARSKNNNNSISNGQE